MSTEKDGSTPRGSTKVTLRQKSKTGNTMLVHSTNYQGSKGSVRILDMKVPLKRRVHFSDPPYFTRGHRDSDEIPNFVINNGLKENKDCAIIHGQLALERGKQTEKSEFTERFRKDKVYRKKVLHTLCIFWAFCVLGWIIGQFGPSFLDLQIITDTTLEEGSAFMTAHSIGYLLGSLTLGLLFDRMDKLLLVFFPLIGNGIIVAIIPWCAPYGLMIVAHSAKGFFSGGLDAVSNAETVYIWGDEGRSFMQALHFSFAVGGILSPLATAPFLVPRHSLPDAIIFDKDVKEVANMTSAMISSSTTLQGLQLYISSNYSVNDSKTMDEDSVLNTTESMSPYVTNGFFSNNSMITQPTSPGSSPPDSQLYIAYTITTALALLAAIPFIVMYLKGRKTEMAECRSDEEKLMNILPFKIKVIILINMSLLLGTYSAIEDTFAGFLTTFCVRQLDWTKAAGSFATSVYWASFGSGRFVGIFLVQFCSPVRIITLYCTLLIMSFVGMYFSADGYFDGGIWICSILGGFALSVIFPTIFTWTESELLPVTGKIASMFLIASSSGTMVNPIVLGFLMDQLTPIWFCYLMLGESIILLFLFLCALYISKRIKDMEINSPETTTNDTPCDDVDDEEIEEEKENLLRDYEKIDVMTSLCFKISE